MEPLIGFIIVAVLYFLPAVIAGMRGHHNFGPIMLVNIFLGWTLLGWFAALVWATTAIRTDVR